MPPAKHSTASQQSGYGDEEKRFVELLKPIKDLTENWEVPLARYLEEYYDEIHDIQISLDGRSSRVNFTEAALLLQGSASVYSKKVEYLWQSVLKMLELLASKKALDEVSGAEESGPNGRRGRKSIFGDSKNFTLVSVEMCTNTDLKSDNQTFSAEGKSKEQHARKMSLKFIFTTPRHLIEKESMDQKLMRVNLYIKTGNKLDLLGHKEDFRINSQFAMATAMIGEDLSSGTELGQQSVSLSESDCSFDSSSCFINPPDQDMMPDDPGGGNDDPGGADDPFDDNFNLQELVLDQDGIELPMGDSLQDPFNDHHTDDPTQPNTDNPNGQNPNPIEGEELTEDDELLVRREVGRRRKDKLAELMEEPRAPLADPWEPVKPHESVPLPKKPRKRGKISKAKPQAIKLTKTSTRSRGRGGEDSIPSVDKFVSEVMAKAAKSTSQMTKADNVPTEIEDEAKKLIKDTKVAKETDGDCEKVAENNVEAEIEDDDGWTDANFEVNDGFDHFDEPEMPQNAHGDVPLSQSDQVSSQVDSYEDLVIKRVADYVAQSQDFLASTELAKRVRLWHESLTPILEEVEKRGDFDVHDYGTKILSEFEDISGTDGDGKSAKTTLNFKHFVAGKSKEEAARVFLSSLMLANTYNVELKNEDEMAGVELPMDHVEMTLLSRTRHHQQLMDYQAPSQEASASSQNLAGSRKRKMKSQPPTHGDHHLNAIVEDDPDFDIAIDIDLGDSDDDEFVPESSNRNKDPPLFKVPSVQSTSRKPSKRK